MNEKCPRSLTSEIWNYRFKIMNLYVLDLTINVTDASTCNALEDVKVLLSGSADPVPMNKQTNALGIVEFLVCLDAEIETSLLLMKYGFCDLELTSMIIDTVNIEKSIALKPKKSNLKNTKTFWVDSILILNFALKFNMFLGIETKK